MAYLYDGKAWHFVVIMVADLNTNSNAIMIKHICCLASFNLKYFSYDYLVNSTVRTIIFATFITKQLRNHFLSFHPLVTLIFNLIRDRN